MKKRWLYSVMALTLTFGMSMTSFAEEFTGDDDWGVYFSEDKKMVSTFGKTEFDDRILQMEPGDTTTITLTLENKYSEDTNWYMTNKVLETLESADDVQAQGGAYSYLLYYTDPSGAQTTLYDSDSVGGETIVDNREGLTQATDSLEDWFFLDALGKGEKGSITLRVKLDGETQGNEYQDTLANLQMNFAVEVVSKTATPSTPKKVTTRPKTGDQTPILIFSIAALVSGLALIIIVIFRLRRRQEESTEAIGGGSGFTSGAGSGAGFKSGAAKRSEKDNNTRSRGRS